MTWRAQANCADHTEMFDRLTDMALGPELTAARALCGACPVASECLQMALETEVSGLRFGVFAGTTPEQRRKMQRKPRDTWARSPLSAEQRARKNEGDRKRRSEMKHTTKRAA